MKSEISCNYDFFGVKQERNPSRVGVVSDEGRFDKMLYTLYTFGVHKY